MKKYSISRIAVICNGHAAGSDTTVDSVMTDSRHSYGADEHPLFVAIAGMNHDGHDFISEMYRRGVRGFIVEREQEASAYPDAGFVVVGSSLKALQALAADSRAFFKGHMIGITGSSGKTTVKEWLARVLYENSSVFRSPRSYNSQLGVPLSVLMMRGDEDVALIEAGISRKGEMEALEQIIRPDIGIFTNIGAEHSENFGNRREQIYAKAALFRSCRTIIYPQCYGEIGEVLDELYPSAELIACPAFESFSEAFGDKESLENASLVATAAALLSGDLRAMSAPDAWIDMELLKRYKPESMRLDIREGISDSIVVGDGNNTDINSIGIALDYLRSVSGQREKLFILTDVVFSSLPRNELYERVAQLTKGAGIDRVIGIGKHISACADSFASIKGEFYVTADEMLRTLNQEKLSGRAILVKGNRSAEYGRIMHALQRRSHTTVLEVNLDAMIHNLNLFRASAGHSAKIMAMVKASSYGNGNYEVANMLQSQSVDYLAVAFADEGVKLREQGIRMPIVVLNADADSFELMVANRLEPEIYNFTSLEMFIRAVKGTSESAYPIHIKFDTGMHRLGFNAEETDKLAETLIKERESVVARSVFSHLAAADMPSEDAFTRRQTELFDALCDRLSEKLPYRPMRHIFNSSGTERFSETRYDMFRLGIGLYGCGTERMRGELRHVSRLTTRIVQIRNVAKGDSVGYGRAERLERDSRLATVPIGYADGLDRHLGNRRWSMLVGNEPAPIVGRVCMDSCMIDVTDIEGVSEGDEVVIFSGLAGNTVDDMARVLDTIPYEVMTSVSERVKRIFVRE